MSHLGTKGPPVHPAMAAQLREENAVLRARVERLEAENEALRRGANQSRLVHETYMRGTEDKLRELTAKANELPGLTATLDELRDRCVRVESAAGFVVRRAELAPGGSSLRERIEALRVVLEGLPTLPDGGR